VLAFEESIARCIEFNVEERSESSLLEDSAISADDLSDKSHFLVKKNGVSLASEIVTRTASLAIASAGTLGDIGL